MNKTADVAVIGGGAIGCSVAYHAAVRGARVVLLESEAELGSGASGALAGMLSGQGEAEDPGPLRDLLVKGREYHKTFEQELYEATGLDPGYVWDGALRTATDEASKERLLKEHSWHEEANLPSEWLSAEEARELEPAISAEIIGGLYLPEDGQVNPRPLVQALAQGGALKGAKIHEATRVTGFVTERERLTGVRTMTQGAISAGTVVLAAGAFSDLLSEQLGVRLPVYPLKGQLLVLHTRPVPIKANIWDSGNDYVVPKKDGRVIVGATEEPDVYDRRTTLGGVAELSRVALGLVPKLAEASFIGAWGGLRPATPSGNPILGPVEGLDGLLLATGHFRNGVLLSAITGEIVGALSLGERPLTDISPFLYDNLEDATPLRW
jgi:glycine oxidase